MTELLHDLHAPVGRIRELEQVDRQLRRLRDVLVISPPLSGLSTFLKQVQNRITTAVHFEPFRAVYLDCNEFHITPQPFIETFHQILLDQLQINHLTSNKGYERSVEFLTRVLEIDDSLNLVLIIDNLQQVSEKELRGFLEQIRVVSESRQTSKSLKRVLFVLGGKCLDLRRLDPDKLSPFNIAERIQLGDLSQGDAFELVNQMLSQSTRPFSSLTGEYIFYLTGGHPYLLTLVCSYLIQDIVPEITTVKRIDFGTVDQVVEAICQDDMDRLLYQIKSLLGNITDSALQCLREILNGARYDSKKYTQDLRELSLSGLVCNSKGPIWQLQNPIYDSFLRRQNCLAPVVDADHFVPRRLFVNVEGYKLLFLLENDLRDFVFSKLLDKFKDQWESKVDEQVSTFAQGLKTKELETGWFSNENLPILAYSQFPHLRKIIEQNWASIFHHYFKPRNIFIGFFETLEGLRNKLAHNRPLTDQDIEQLETIADRFRNCMYEVSFSIKHSRSR